MNTFNTSDLLFAPVNGKKLSARFDDPAVSSDGGALFLREVDGQIGLSERLATAITDGRRQSHVTRLWTCCASAHTRLVVDTRMPMTAIPDHHRAAGVIYRIARKWD